MKSTRYFTAVLLGSSLIVPQAWSSDVNEHDPADPGHSVSNSTAIPAPVDLATVVDATTTTPVASSSTTTTPVPAVEDTTTTTTPVASSSTTTTPVASSSTTTTPVPAVEDTTTTTTPVASSSTTTPETFKEKIVKWLDFNHDGKLDFGDVPAFFTHILDFNHDGKLDMGDLTAFADDVKSAVTNFSTIKDLVENEAGAFMNSSGFELLPANLQTAFKSSYNFISEGITKLSTGTPLVGSIVNSIKSALSSLEGEISSLKKASDTTVVTQGTKAAVALAEAAKRVATNTSVANTANSIEKKVARVYNKAQRK